MIYNSDGRMIDELNNAMMTFNHYAGKKQLVHLSSSESDAYYDAKHALMMHLDKCWNAG